MGNRSPIEIMGQILEAVNDGRSYSKSQIMYRALLSAALTRQYVNTLSDSGLLMHDLTSQTYKLTENGRDFLQIYDEINDIINLSEFSDLAHLQGWIEEEVDQRTQLAKGI